MAEISVKEFGAIGNGYTDDTEAIQTAINVAGPENEVVIPNGDYRISSSLYTNRNDVIIKGLGDQSILRLTNECRVPLFSIPTPYYISFNTPELRTNITISNLVIDGNYNGPGNSTTGDYFGIIVRQAKNLNFNHLIIRNWISDGCTFSNGYRPIQNLTMEDCWIHTVKRNGIHVGFADGVIIRRNRISNVPSQHISPSAANAIDIEVEGYDLYGPVPHTPYINNVLIEDNILEREYTKTSSDGVALQPAYGPMSNIIIRNNVIRGHQIGIEMTGALGIYDKIAGIVNVLIENNMITSERQYSVSGYAMSLVGGYNVNVIGNVINDVTNGAFSGYSIGIFNAKNVKVAKNKLLLFPHGLTAIGQARGSENVEVVENFYQTDKDVDFIDSGSNVNLVVKNNIPLSEKEWDRECPIIKFNGIRPITSEPCRTFFFMDGIPIDKNYPSKDLPVGKHMLGVMAVDNSANLSGLNEIKFIVGSG